MIQLRINLGPLVLLDATLLAFDAPDTPDELTDQQLAGGAGTVVAPEAHDSWTPREPPLLGFR